MELIRSRCFIYLLTLLSISTRIKGNIIPIKSVGQHIKDGTSKLNNDDINNKPSALKVRKQSVDSELKGNNTSHEDYSHGDNLFVEGGDLVVKTSVGYGQNIVSRKENLEQGQSVSFGPLQCEKYLIRFGYLREKDADHAATKRAAYMKFQENFNLRSTGVCDRRTKWLMRQPRCTRQDPNGEKSNRRSKRFVLNGKKWMKKSLTYGIGTLDDYLTHPRRKLNEQDINQLTAQALKFWHDASQLTITRSSNNSPDIEVSFFIGPHHTKDDDSNFNGPGKVLAHAFDPEDGDVHFDGDEPWTRDRTSGINFLQVATHEFGHSLGLNHSNTNDAVMASIYRGYQRNFELQQDDIDAIQTLYGAPPSREGVYVGYGADIIFYNIAKFIEVRITIDYDVAGCSSDNSQVQELICRSIREQARKADMEIKLCKYSRISGGRITHVEFDIIPSHLGTTLSQLSSIINRNTLTISPCVIVSTGFTATPLMCSSIFKSTCAIGHANCQPLTIGYTCVCPSGYIISDHTSPFSSCRPIQAKTTTTTTKRTPTFQPQTTRKPLIERGNLSDDLVLGLSIGGGIIFVIILVVLIFCCCCRQRNTPGPLPISGTGGYMGSGYVSYPAPEYNKFPPTNGPSPPGRGFWYA